MRSDEELMTAYSEGDPSAFEELYQRCQSRVFGYLVKRCSSKEMAEEIFQATFLKLHELRGRYRPEQPFMPWLFLISKSVWIDRLRKEKAESRKLEEYSQTATSTHSEEKAHELDEALASLSSEQRELIRLRYEEGFSFEEISQRIKVKEPALRQSLSRLTRKLKAAVKGSAQ